MAGSTAFVLVHGAWHGGWCYDAVAGRLRDLGHEVWAPTLSGMAERARDYSPAINLSTHIGDIVGLLRGKDLRDVVLCGHSYGGMVITGVADRVPERIAALVYLDAYVPQDGQAAFDLDLPEATASHIQKAGWNGGHTLPPPENWSGGNAERLTAQPLATLCEKIRLTGPGAVHARRMYIYAARWGGPSPFDRTYEGVKAEGGWTHHALDCGHMVMTAMPERLVELLRAAALP